MRLGKSEPLGLASDVELQELATECGSSPRPLIGVDVGQDDMRSLVRESLAHGLADAPRAAGDDADLSVEFPHDRT